MHAFWLAFGLVFLAEVGDKTQLVALTLATRFNSRVVLAGILAATLLVHVFSAALGGLFGELLPTAWIGFLAGLAFIGFGLWTLRGDEADGGGAAAGRTRSPFWLVTVTFFLAEVGDKTMLTTVTLAATLPFVPVWLGSTLGMVTSDAVAIWVGRALGARLPERMMKLAAAGVFLAFGLVEIVRGGSHLPAAAWVLGAALVGAMTFFLLRGSRSLRRPIRGLPVNGR